MNNLNWIKQQDVSNEYEATISNITVRIVGEPTITKKSYAKYIAYLFSIRESEIIDYVAGKLTDYYRERFGYSKEDIKSRLGQPVLKICHNDYGSITWLDHTLDEHIIECEFFNDLILSPSITLDG